MDKESRVGLTAEDNLTVKELEKLLKAQKNSCARCGKKFEGLKFQIAHVKSVKNGGHCNIQNIQLLCTECNRNQGTKNIMYMSADISAGNVNIKTR